MKKIILIFSLLLLVFACSKTEDAQPDNNYDKTVLLTNWADNIIVPSFVNYQSKVNNLTASCNTFTATPTEANLIILRNSWIETYKAFQYVSLFNFGKSEKLYFNEVTNTYPTDTAGINANITSGNYDLTILQNKKQGLPALDYLINGLGATDTAILDFYSNNQNANNYKKYLKDVIAIIKSNADLIVTDWNTSYRNQYIENTGTSVTGAVNVTTNNFVKNLEKDIRTSKIGFPSGIFSGGVTKPENIEALYKNDISKILLNESLKASQDFFNGKKFNGTTTGPSLKSYLDFVKNNQQLSDLINSQYTKIFAANSLLNNSFSTQIASDNSKMLSAYDVLQQNVIYTKLDMMQALNISIGYTDSDGD